MSTSAPTICHQKNRRSWVLIHLNKSLRGKRLGVHGPFHFSTTSGHVTCLPRLEPPSECPKSCLHCKRDHPKGGYPAPDWDLHANTLPSKGRDSGIHGLSIVVRNSCSLPRNSCSALSMWRQTREDGDTTQADGKPGKLPIPLQNKRWSHKTPHMSSSAQCVGHNAEESFGLKKINRNDLQEAWGRQESNCLSK